MPIAENMINHADPSQMLEKVADLYPNGTNIHSFRSPTFESLSTGYRYIYILSLFPTFCHSESLIVCSCCNHKNSRLNTQSLSPRGVPTMQMQHNPFIDANSGIIPGPMSLNCDNSQFINSWIKYILQSAICVTTHTLSFFITILWFRFLFSSYFEYQYHNHHNNDNDLSRYTESILSHLPGSSWIWIALCMTNIVFCLGFMIHFWIMPIQWNFEDNSNTKLFRYFGISFVILTIITNITLSIFQLCGFHHFHDISNLTQLVVVCLFSFILLFVIIKNGRSSNSLNPMDSNPVVPDQSGSDIDLSPDRMDRGSDRFGIPEIDEIHEIEIVKRSHFRIHRIAAFANHHSCTKLLFICAIFSCIITATMILLDVAFRYLLPFILSHNTAKTVWFDGNFVVHLALILFAVLMTGNMLILGMRVLTRWLTVLVTDSSDTGRRQHKVRFYNVLGML